MEAIAIAETPVATIPLTAKLLLFISHLVPSNNINKIRNKKETQKRCELERVCREE